MRNGIRMAFAIGLLTVTTATVPALAAEAATAEGVVQSAEDGRVTLKTAAGETTVIVSDDTKVHDGKTPIPKKAIRAGDVVVVQGTRGSSGAIDATDIQVKPGATDKQM